MSTGMNFMPEAAPEAATACLDDVSNLIEPDLVPPKADEVNLKFEDLIDLDILEDAKKTTQNEETSVGSGDNSSSDHETLVGEPTIPVSGAEIETEEMKPVKDLRIRGGFRPITPRKMDQSGNFLLAGHLDDNKVIHVVTRVERFLCQTKTTVALGHRFVPHEPDRLVLGSNETGGEGHKSDGLAHEIAPGSEYPDKFLLPFTVKKRDGNQYHYHEHFEIKESPMGGLGCFAVKDLHRHDLILMETPILRTDGFNLHKNFRALDEETQQIYMTLHAIKAKGLDEVERIRRANAFEIPGGVAILAIGSRFNHGCGHKRNVRYTYDRRRNVMSFEVLHDTVLAGEELLVSYGGSPSSLYRSYGFRCQCGGCRGLTDEDVQRIEDEEYGNWW